MLVEAEDGVRVGEQDAGVEDEGSRSCGYRGHRQLPKRAVASDAIAATEPGTSNAAPSGAA